MNRKLLTFILVALTASAAYAIETHKDRQYFTALTVPSGGTLTIASGGTLANAGTLTTSAVYPAAAGALALGNTTATSVSICNSAACDTLTLGTNTDADAITIGDTNDTTALVSALWSITGPGVGTFSSVLTPGIDTATAVALPIGATTATSVGICNSAACDTISIGTNTDADTINIGEVTDLTNVFGAVVRPSRSSTLSTADTNLTKANIQAADYFPVDTSASAIDVDFGDDAVLDTADIGTNKTFMVLVGHATQALTVTAGESGVTTVTTINTLGTTCEDEGDMIICTPRSTTKATCRTFCAD